jgi:hypothetical protein
VFDEAVFPFSQLPSPAVTHYTADFLLPDQSRHSSDLHVHNIPSNPDISPQLVLSFSVLQPHKIQTTGSAPVRDSESPVDSLLGSAPSAAASSGTEIHGELQTSAAAPVSSTAHQWQADLLPPCSSSGTLASDHCQVVRSSAPTAGRSASVVWPESASAPALGENAPCTRSKSGIHKPKIFSDGTVRYGNLATIEEPENLAAALADSNWKGAMESEFSA